MDNATHEQFVQELKDFLTKPCYDFARREYNRRMLKKMEELHKSSLVDTENICRVKGGEISGFKNGFELFDTLINEFERKEAKE